VFSLVRHREPVRHPEAERLADRTHYGAVCSFAALAAQVYWLRRRPLAYLGAWYRSLVGNLRSPKFLIRALAIVPQAALFARQMQALGVSHVHAHFATHPALSAYVINRLSSLPYSITTHAHDIYVDRAMLEEKMRRASFVVANTRFNEHLLRQWYGPLADARVVVIRHGNDLSVFAPRSGSRSNVFTILCVASLEDYKGHRYLVEACALLAEQGVAFECLLVGEGPERPALEAQIAARGLQGRVNLLGQQARERVAELMARADVVAMPSVITSTGKMEGLPMAVQEALATEIPVVATAISGIPELVEHEHTGLLVPERDAAALAGALRRVHDDPALAARLGKAGRARVMSACDLHTNVAQLRQLLLRDWNSQDARKSAAA